MQLQLHRDLIHVLVILLWPGRYVDAAHDTTNRQPIGNAYGVEKTSLKLTQIVNFGL